MYARTSFGPEKQPQLREFFYADDIHREIQVGPPPGILYNKINKDYLCRLSVRADKGWNWAMGDGLYGAIAYIQQNQQRLLV